MNSANRRHVLGLGLAAGASAVVNALNPALAANEPATPLAGLRFRLPATYHPDLSAKIQQQLARAILDFLLAAHPPGTTLSMWNANPRDMPFLEEHLVQVVSAVVKGIEINLPGQPVDPVLIVAMLYNESRFYPLAMSPTGALGMAQFMPETALQFGLGPIARPDLWERYRLLRTSERERRAQLKQTFLTKFMLTEFSPTAVIERALATNDLAVLQEYQLLATAVKPESTALQEYVTTVQSDFAALNYFGGDAARINTLDGRTSYAAVSKAVDYVARRLTENSGMASSAIAAYNAGPAAVNEGNSRSVLYGYGDLPAYAETVQYLQRVMVVYTKLQELLELPPASENAAVPVASGEESGSIPP